jgi:hypothetical protein
LSPAILFKQGSRGEDPIYFQSFFFGASQQRGKKLLPLRHLIAPNLQNCFFLRPFYLKKSTAKLLARC